MIRILQAMTENLKLSATVATSTSISSGLFVWGIPLHIFLQTVGVVVAVVSAVISAIFLFAMFIEKKRSNKKQEAQKDRELDIRERELESK